MSDSARTLLVLAKEPRPGLVKTRLEAEFTAEEAADLASWAIEDTLQAVRSSTARRRILAWEGDPHPWNLEFEIIAQPVGSLNDRLCAAFVLSMFDAPSSPVLLIGMDTPQVTPSLLDTGWEGADAVLGLSEDGGFWAIGLRSGDPGQVFDGVEMSSERTGAAQLARLTDLGYSVRLLPRLRDVDSPADAEAIAGRYPQLGFSRRYRQLIAARTEQTA